MTPPKLLIATTNDGKISELRQLAARIKVDLISLTDFPTCRNVDETGATFDENARLKAAGYAIQFGLPTLADDSGLAVEALDGRPGVFSARYGGDISYPAKIALLLAEIQRTGDLARRARFICSIAVADMQGNILVSVEGVCEGTIASEPRGNNGFGYDPVFTPAGYDQTFGELSEVVKHRISHRAVAFSKIIPYLLDFGAV